MFAPPADRKRSPVGTPAEGNSAVEIAGGAVKILDEFLLFGSNN